MIAALISLFCFLLLSSFFSGMEMAFISSSRLKVELSKTQGKLSGRALAHFMKNPSRFIGTYLIGNNVALVLFSGLLGGLLSPWIQKNISEIQIIDILIQVLVATIIILIFGEFLPKLIFRLRADRLLHFFSIPFTLIYFLLYIPVRLINGLTRFLIRVFFGIQFNENEPVFTEVDLEHYIKETMHRSQDDQVDAVLLENALDFRELKVRACMVPRPEITAVEVNESIEYLKETFIQSGYSKVLVYDNDIDDVLGYVHHFDLHHNPKDIKQMVKTIPIVPETMPAQTLMTEFKHRGKSMALVVDEYGGTAGIITFEDVLEELFGEIIDEHDEEEFIEEQLSKNEYLFSGRLEIDYINTTYDINLPKDDDFETLSGYIIHITENIPSRGDIIMTENFEFHIINVSNTKIETVKLTLK